LVLACWLLWGGWPGVLWLTTFCTVLALTIASLVLAMEDRSSCGCFGEIEVSPWYTFGLDLCLLIGLVWARSPLEELSLKMPRPGAGRFLIATKMALLMIGVPALIAWFVSVALAFPKEEIVLETSTVELTRAPTTGFFEFPMTVLNSSNRPLRIVGGKMGCSPDVVSGFPIDIPPGQSKPVVFTIATRQSQGRYRRTLWLYCADGNHLITFKRRVAASLPPRVP
jgi:hypothetical protein